VNLRAEMQIMVLHDKLDVTRWSRNRLAPYEAE